MAETTPTDPPKPRVRFHYIKSNFFRVVHYDGAIGGLTPAGLIHLAAYSERPAIPQVTEHDVLVETGALGPATNVEGKAGVVREVEVDLMMTRAKASELRDWLSQRIEELDRILKETQGAQT